MLSDGRPHVVRFRAGYSRDSDYADCLVTLRKGYGIDYLGAPESECYILDIRNIAGYQRKET